MEKIILFVNRNNYYRSLKKVFNNTGLDFQRPSNFLSSDYNLVKIYF